jgi:hypothetical protein
MSPMNNRLLVPRKTPGLLDLVPGAAAAYSLRSLSNSYAGPVVTVRRSSDDAEEDFTAAEVSDGTLAAFCGAGDGFVKQWWDQSGNARHAVAPADANEPKIVDSGIVVTEEGKPALQFDGSDDYMQNAALGAVFLGADVPLSSFAVLRNTNTAAIAIVCGFGNTGTETQLLRPYYADSDGSFRIFNRDDANASKALDFGVFGEAQQLISSVSTGTALSVWQNGANILSGGDINLGLMTFDVFAIGALVRTSPSGYWLGTMQELILYKSVVSSQRELIEGNIAWGYSV